MPTLHWIGKDKVINHHRDVPYKVLEHGYGFDAAKGKTKQPTGSGNKVIHGDNLEALKSLLPEYEGKVKCIYIDPPYNTGNEGWVYNDNVNDPRIKKWLGEVVGKEGEDLSRHDKWLCMMYPRLVLLHKLLADDGTLWVSLDDNEQGHARLILDEIFGPGNFVVNICWEKKYTVANDAKQFSDNHDFILCYAKSKTTWRPNRLPRTEKMNKAYTNPDNHPKGPWKPTPLQAKSGSEEGFVHVFANGVKWQPPPGRFSGYSHETLDALFAGNEIWFGKDGTATPSRKTFMSELKSDGLVPRTIWRFDDFGHNHEAGDDFKKVLPEQVFNSPKPIRLVKSIVNLGAGPNDIILDSFAGSGTTAHAVLNLNEEDGGSRKFILIEMMDYAETITAERVKRVMKGYGESSKKTEGTGGAFDYYTLGAPLFNGQEQLNEDVGVERIREYIWYSETRAALVAPVATAKGKRSKASPYYLGMHERTAYYFVYEAKALTTLDHEMLGTLPAKGERTVIYADNCLLPKKFLEQHGIVFKKIPRDISRF